MKTAATQSGSTRIHPGAGSAACCCRSTAPAVKANPASVIMLQQRARALSADGARAQTPDDVPLRTAVARSNVAQKWIPVLQHVGLANA
jgi:hypothetical protein